MGSGKDILGCPESCVALVPERLAGGDEWCGRQALAVKILIQSRVSTVSNSMLGLKTSQVQLRETCQSWNPGGGTWRLSVNTGNLTGLETSRIKISRHVCESVSF